MSKLLTALLKEQKRLKSTGWKPKFKGDTGMNIAQLMVDNDVELRNEWDKAFINTFKQLKDK
jgi:hypothetical protein|tara:strand:- start:872 stop:1057 length:186 start_codon:yes stop_codon:yes gene_type:complete